MNPDISKINVSKKPLVFNVVPSDAEVKVALLQLSVSQQVTWNKIAKGKILMTMSFSGRIQKLEISVVIVLCSMNLLWYRKYMPGPWHQW